MPLPCSPSVRSPRRAFPRACAAATALALAAMLPACADRDDEDVATLHPGDSWFDVAERVSVVTAPESNLPPEIEALLDEQATRVVIPPSAWTRGRAVPDAQLSRLRLEGEAFTWRLDEGDAVARFPEPSPVRTRMFRDGRPLEAVDRPGDVDYWWDEAEALFVMVERGAPLRAVAAERPGELVLVDTAVGLEVLADEVVRTPVAVVDEATGAEHAAPDTVEIGRVRRRAFRAPAPTVLELQLDELRGDALHAAVGVIENGWAVVGGVAVRRGGASDGVTFVVEVEDAGQTHEVWRRHVEHTGAWEHAEVDLSAWTGRAVTLRLRTDPGPAGDAAFDYAAWGDLRLRGEPEVPPRRPHVVLLHLDTLRADRLGCYGYEVPTSPRLDAWAEQHAVVFEDALVDASSTLPSTSTILTGLTQHQHLAGLFPTRVGPEHEPIALALRRAGYETYAMTEGVFLNPDFGFATGFDVFDWRTDQDPDWDRALRWLEDARGRRPVFLFLQTYLVHHPFAGDDERLPREDGAAAYDGWLADVTVKWNNVIGPVVEGQLELDEEERAYVRRLYDADVRRLDDVLGDFLARLDEVLPSGERLVLITSDHGDEHFEHGSMDHGHSLYHEILHVPLIADLPDRGPGRVTAPVSTLDLVPTIRDYAELPPSPSLPGRSLREALPERRPRVGRRHAGEWSLVHDGWKLIVADADVPALDVPTSNPDTAAGAAGESDDTEVHPHAGVVDAPRLYDLRADPRERRDLSTERPERLEQMLALLVDYVNAHPRPAHLDAADEAADDAALDAYTLEQLEALGYLGG